MLGGGFKMMGGFPTILLGLVFLAAEVVGSDNLTGENKQMKLPVSHYVVSESSSVFGQVIALVKTQEIMLWSQMKYSAHLALWVKTHDNRNVTYELGCHLDLWTGLLRTVVPMCVWSQNMGI